MASVVYKVISRELWRAAEDAGMFEGADVDRRDGYIHLSTQEQVVETVALHFAGMTDLLLIAIDPDQLSETLRWEPSRGGHLFPHVYGSIPMTAVVGVNPLPLGEDGAHQFPFE